MKFESKGLISLDINGSIYDYKLYQSLESLSRTKSQRKSAKELNISHTVFNRRLLKAEEKSLAHAILLSCSVVKRAHRLKALPKTDHGRTDHHNDSGHN